MTRTTDVPLDLGPRIALAESSDAEVLVSIHNNALPDGVNPFTNNGTSVFYNHVTSLPLARAVQRGLVQNLGLRDLGVGRGDLALVRPTWQPSILTEGLYMIVPEQEAALRSSEGQRRYAQGVIDGLAVMAARICPSGDVNPARSWTSLKLNAPVTFPPPCRCRSHHNLPSCVAALPARPDAPSGVPRGAPCRTGP